MHACTHAHMHARIHACMHERMHAYTHARMPACLHARIPACTHARMHTKMCVSTNAIAHAPMHACTPCRIGIARDCVVTLGIRSQLFTACIKKLSSQSALPLLHHNGNSQSTKSELRGHVDISRVLWFVGLIYESSQQKLC